MTTCPQYRRFGTNSNRLSNRSRIPDFAMWGNAGGSRKQLRTILATTRHNPDSVCPALSNWRKPHQFGVEISRLTRDGVAKSGLLDCRQQPAAPACTHEGPEFSHLAGGTTFNGAASHTIPPSCRSAKTAWQPSHNQHCLRSMLPPVRPCFSRTSVTLFTRPRLAFSASCSEK